MRYLFRNRAILSLSGPRPDGLAKRPDGLCYNSFLLSNETLEYFEILDSVRTCCHIIRTTCRDFPNSVDFWNLTPCWILIDLAVWTVLLYCPDVLKTNCWTLRGIRTPSKDCSDGYTGIDCSNLEIAWNLHWHLLRNLWPYTWHEMRHCPYYLKTLNRTDNPVKKQPLHKVFLSTRMLPI